MTDLYFAGRLISPFLKAAFRNLFHDREKVEVIDVATLAALIRCAHNWQGSHQGWTPSNNPLAPSPVSKMLSGLDRFCMTGHWVNPPEACRPQPGSDHLQAGRVAVCVFPLSG